MDSALGQPSPLTERVRIAETTYANDELQVRADVVVDRANPILAGHYPGMPIFPGVCLIECAHHAVLLAARDRNLAPALEAVATARFLEPVFPGDAVSIQLRIAKDATRWKAAARLHCPRGLAARLTLHYRLSGGEPCTG